jgi:hypothetical protein
VTNGAQKVIAFFRDGIEIRIIISSTISFTRNTTRACHSSDCGSDDKSVPTQITTGMRTEKRAANALVVQEWASCGERKIVLNGKETDELKTGGFFVMEWRTIASLENAAEY